MKPIQPLKDAQDCIQAAADLSWLDEDLLDLRTVVHEYFDLTTEFDISLHLDVLADEATKGHPHNNQQGYQIVHHRTQQSDESGCLDYGSPGLCMG